MPFLKLENITKVYPKSENQVPALSGINIEANHRGLVFVIGKSGSGKSTLLNLIGGLDVPTEGDIIVKDRRYSEFSSRGFDSLRRNEIGFVFQDFCLIDGLDVYENVRLAALIKDEEVDKDAIYEAVARVGLAGLERRTVTNLSAGQRQRVAIARAIIKHPEILLCDEPTGNLDFVTSHEILSILKDLSKDALVILVSHNLEDAYVYADRIIELKEGRIVNDIENTHEGLIVDDTAYISGIDFISKENLEVINEGIQSGTIKQIQSKKQLFQPYEHKDAEYERITYKNRHISSAKSFSLMNRLLKRQFVKIGLFSFIAALITSMFAVCFMFVTYTPDIVYSQVADQAQTIAPLFRKETELNQRGNRVSPLTEADFAKIDKLIPDEKYYKVVGHNAFFCESYQFDNGAYPAYDGTSISYLGYILDTKLYVKDCGGVVLTDESHLQKVFNQPKIEYWAKADKIEDGGVYVTDFLIDERIGHKKFTDATYADYVGVRTDKYANKEFNRFYVNGVIKTDYKTKYATLLSRLQKARTNNPDDLKKVRTSKEFLAFMLDMYVNYIPTYSFNPNYIADYAKASFKNYYRVQNAVYTVNFNGEPAVIHNYSNTSIGNVNLTSRLYNFPGEASQEATKTIYFPYNVLNNIFGTVNTADGWNELLKADNKVHVALYDPVTNEETFAADYQLIAGATTSYTMASQDVIDELSAHGLTYADILLDRQTNIKQAFTKLAANSYISFNVSNAFPRHISTGVEMYIDFFKIMLAISLGALFLILVFVSVNNVRRFTYEIGVIKSLGAGTQDIYRIFAFQELYLLIGAMVMAVIGTYIATALSNMVLTAAFNRNFNPIYHISILWVDYRVLLVELAIILAVSVLAMIVPFIAMKRLRPIHILKAKY